MGAGTVNVNMNANSTHVKLAGASEKMAYSVGGEKLSEEVVAARTAVARAETAYSRGGSVNAVNKANARLAAAHDRLREFTGLRIPSDK
jgi:hypothetical protein